jgi:epoxyqueuosine reductase
MADPAPAPDYAPTPDWRAKARFVPSAAQMALWPAGVSGNALNGLGETVPRRPSRVYWHHPASHPFGAVQRWMLARSNHFCPEVRDLNRDLGGRGPKEPAPIAPVRAEDTAENWSRRVKAAAAETEAVQAGIARVDPLWVYEGCTVTEPWLVVLAVPMDHAELSRLQPDTGSVVEVMRAYNAGTRAAKAVADWIRAQGWHAAAHGGPIAGPLTLIPAALAAGFGELGKHGSIINRRLGSSFRLAGVLTDLPLAPDAADAFGADDFCAACQVCQRACPPAAIAPAKQTVRGVTRWYVDFDRCLPYFNETYGCGICIAVCPWSRPGAAPSLAERMTRRRARRAADP